ncbi:uncharacterized protein BT62DRAFT_254068 [Guyanagaster necrorhizus]|uniref:Uncharacterized protein n=1 Tax=Guyanagaster necrorhizus TaxID=856835 RepID=A0A9P7VPC3_9AGAR|nr:uncharacterized protein BT62DRAFT_254068 [Guyanagaster necrorhizus MCA 3950]KAG7444147.1 hypothetical protein BT62DRAFT_254068 [Guyanagaster necrorhizus MCA 3950]
MIFSLDSAVLVVASFRAILPHILRYQVGRAPEGCMQIISADSFPWTAIQEISRSLKPSPCQWVYVLLDLEDDYGINYYLQHHVKDDILWQRTPLGLAMEHFWSLIKLNQEEGFTDGVFVMGVMPVATTDGIILGNISFHPEFCWLCGPSNPVVSVAMDKMGFESNSLLKTFGEVYTDGYHCSLSILR